MRLRHLAFASLVAPLAPAFAQEAPVIVVTGQGLEQTPATPAYDVIELDRETLRVTDTLSGDTGTLTGWRLHLW